MTKNTATTPDFDYEMFDESLANAECDSCASEVQAFLCGMLVAGADQKDMKWLNHLSDYANDGRLLPTPTFVIVQKVFEWTASLLEQDFTTPVLLPDDGYPAVDQMEAIAAWCEGFLSGFGLLFGGHIVNSREMSESLTDLTEITRLELEAEDNEETQEALLTVIEHVKVAVQTIYCETKPLARTSVEEMTPVSKTIH